MVAVVGNMAKGMTNVDYKVIIEVFVEVYFEVIIKRNVIFVRS